MIRDVFYYGQKPNVHPRERKVSTFEEARNLCTTDHFWIINEFCDYENFDWDFDFETLPDEDVWASDHINIWPSQHQKDSGTWLVSKSFSDIKIYRNDVPTVNRKKIITYNWNIVEKIDEDKFDLSWHPDSTEPPFIYRWGCKYYPVEVQHVIEYAVEGATQVKYMDQVVELLPDGNMLELQEVDKDKFDLSFRPDPREPPFIYIWGNKYIPGVLKSTLEYHTPSATQNKYMSDDVPVTPEWNRWFFLKDVDETSFDFTWRPDPREPPFIYVFGNNYYDSVKMPTMYYIVENATDKKYMDMNVKLKPKPDLFEKFEEFTDFDYSWTPDPYDPPYIYVWGNQYNAPTEKISVQYKVKNATEYKYMDTRVRRTACMDNWNVIIPIIENSFDFSWEPPAKDPPFIYVFGNTYNDAVTEPTVEYVVKGATQRKYMTDMVAKPKPQPENFIILEDVEYFDFSWRPNPNDPPYIYVFGNQWFSGNIMPTIHYVHKNGTELKFIDNVLATLSQKPELFQNRRLVKSFDYSWRPHPNDEPYIYQFGTQWQKTNGPTFVVENATEVKYIHEPKAIILANNENWEIPNDIVIDNFDFSWHPDETSPPYIYQFGTIYNQNDGPRYVVPGNDGSIVYEIRKEISSKLFPKYTIKTTLNELIEEHIDEIFWAVRDTINYENFNFDWGPDQTNVYHINAFGSPESEDTCTYLVNGKMIQKGHRSINFVNTTFKLNDENLSKLFKRPSMFFIDKGNKTSNSQYAMLKEKFPDIQKTRYLNSWIDTIVRCTKKSETELCWILDSELDYSNFDFEYYPNPWQMKMLHMFGTQWNHWGTTYLINVETFANDTKYLEKIEHLQNINFVKQRRAKTTQCLHDIVVIDYKNNNLEEFVNNLHEKTDKKPLVVSYKNNLLDTLKDIIGNYKLIKDHFVWIVSTISDYTDFDFTYIADPFAIDQLHTFPANYQKYGDTFFVNLLDLSKEIESIDKLNDYSKINFNETLRSKRLPTTTIVVENDTHVKFKEFDYSFPYVHFVTYDNKDIEPNFTEPMSMWDHTNKNIIINSEGATHVTIPSIAKEYVKDELYDYPYIISNKNKVKSYPLDIVFLSNGELCAEENYHYLLESVKNYKNRIVRVEGVNGRVKAYHAAAQASQTPWMFTVFAKLKVNNKFDWNWQPDRLQKPKHYIFHALNPLNGLVYGHQAMIAYNKNIVLANNGKGLDFTLDNEHEVCRLNSGVAMFNTDEFSTWRTAFRETIKLANSSVDIDQLRLEVWLEKAEGEFAEYCLMGAKDGVDYHSQVNGDIEKLKLSYDWAWCGEYFNKKYV